MSYQEERRFVLGMLETGQINLAQATQLLDVLSRPSVPRSRITSHQPAPDKIYLEIDADQHNLQTVMLKLNQAFSRVEQVQS
jgi:hypothetical protein